MRWHECEPGPSVHGMYLVYRPGGDGYGDYIGVALWWPGDNEWHDANYQGPHKISHWMPLPEKP